MIFPSRPLRFSVRGRGERSETQGMRWQLLNCEHPPSPLTLREGGRFLAPLGMTWLAAGIQRGRDAGQHHGNHFKIMAIMVQQIWAMMCGLSWRVLQEE